MRLFVLAVDAGSLSGAARRSGLSLSSVSRHLSALEQRIGARLLIRSTRNLALTEEGRTYEQNARRLLADLDDMEAGIAAKALGPSGPAGKVQLCAPTLFGRIHVLPLLARFLVQHPAVTLDVTLLDRRVNLVEEGMDIAIVIGALEDSTLIARRLGAIQWVFCASPDYLAARGTPRSPAELADHDGLVYGQHQAAAEWPLRDHGQISRVRIPVRARCNTVDGVIAAAQVGAGICYVPAWSVAKQLTDGSLRVLLRDHEVPSLPVHAVFTHSRLLATKVRALVDLLAAQLGAMDFEAVPEPQGD